MKPDHQPLSDELAALDADAMQKAHGVRMDVGALIRVLRNVQDTRLYAYLGLPDLYAYCIKRLRMSGSEARLRIHAVKKVYEIPELLPALEDGRLTLTNLDEIKHMLTPANAKKTIADFAFKTKLEAQELVARLHPKPAKKSKIRKMPAAHASENPTYRQPVTPHAADVYKLVIMITGVLFREIQELLAWTKRENPTGDLVLFIKECLLAYREKLEKLRFGRAAVDAEGDKSRPRKTKPSKDPAYVSGAVRRAVWERDGGQCTFVAQSTAERCSARTYLEVDHIDSRARGGEGKLENLRLLCPVHHQLVTEEMFGRDFITQKIESRKKAKTEKGKAPSTTKVVGASARARNKRKATKKKKAASKRQPRPAHSDSPKTTAVRAHARGG